MAEIKTKATNASVEDFLNAIPNQQKREDAFIVLEMMKTATKEKPRLWGSAIIGFGDHRYKSAATGREVDWFKIGFSPRKATLSLYLVMDIKKHKDVLKKLGKHKTGVGCLYINKLADVDLKVLKAMIADSLKRF